MAIPKKIHYCWLGRNPKPKSVLKCIESWKKFCPDYEIIEWNEDNLDISSHLYSKQAYDAKAWAFATDYFRLWIIYTHGGIYLDTDVQVIKPLDPLLENKAFIGFETVDEINTGAGFGAEAGSPFLAENMKAYESLVFVKADGTYDKTPAPYYSTEVARKYGLTADAGKVQTVLDLTCYPREYFSPKEFFTGRIHLTRNTYTIHHYSATWYTEEDRVRQKRDTLVARLRYVTRIPRAQAEKILGTKRYKHMVASIKSIFLKGKKK